MEVETHAEFLGMQKQEEKRCNMNMSTGHKKREEHIRIPVTGKDVRCAIDQPYVKNAKSAE